MKKSFLPAMAIMILFLLLTHPALSLEGARNGLLLWYQTVLPTLLPFMICSNVIVSLDGIRLMTAPARPVLRKCFRLSENGSYVFLSGLLCGYPMGAKTCSEFVSQEKLSPREGQYLLSICNHPSPMFLLGYAAALMDPSIPASLLMLAVYLPVIPLAFLARSLYRIQASSRFRAQKTQPCHNFDDSMMKSFEVMIKIGGYLMLFSILARFIGQLSFLPSKTQAMLLGAVEITTGIQAVTHTFTGPIQGMLVCVTAVFGGICGLFQTKSVVTDHRLSLAHYILWKLLHGLLSAAAFLALTPYFMP